MNYVLVTIGDILRVIFYHPRLYAIPGDLVGVIPVMKVGLVISSAQIKESSIRIFVGVKGSSMLITFIQYRFVTQRYFIIFVFGG